jgi:hypothetical protein
MTEQDIKFPVPEDVQRGLDAKRAERDAEFDRLEDMGIFTSREIEDRLRQQFGDLDIPAEQIEAEAAAELERARKAGSAAVKTAKKSNARRRPSPALGPRQLNIADGDKRVEAEHSAYTRVDASTRQVLSGLKHDGPA